MDCQLQAPTMHKDGGPVLQDTIHDHRARGVVVLHAYSKRKSKREREREGKARGERESGGKAHPAAAK